mgnify:CR=1 FL=1
MSVDVSASRLPCGTGDVALVEAVAILLVTSDARRRLLRTEKRLTPRKFNG